MKKKVKKHPSASNFGFETILQRPEIVTWRAIQEAKNIIYSVLESNLQKCGSTVPRFQIMFFLYFEGAMSPSVLADKMTVSRGNITAFLRRMIADNLIKTTLGKSENRPKYTLTVKGKREFEQIFPSHADRVTRLVPAMDEKALFQLKMIKEHAEKIRNYDGE